MECNFGQWIQGEIVKVERIVEDACLADELVSEFYIGAATAFRITLKEWEQRNGMSNTS